MSKAQDVFSLGMLRLDYRIRANGRDLYLNPRHLAPRDKRSIGSNLLNHFWENYLRHLWDDDFSIPRKDISNFNSIIKLTGIFQRAVEKSHGTTTSITELGWTAFIRGDQTSGNVNHFTLISDPFSNDCFHTNSGGYEVVQFTLRLYVTNVDYWGLGCEIIWIDLTVGTDKDGASIANRLNQSYL